MLTTTETAKQPTNLRKRARHFQIVLACILFGVPAPAPRAAVLVNGSFENGLTGWSTSDLSNPLTPLQVVSNGFNNGWFFSTVATAGQYSLVTGFDGAGPGTISFAQDIGTVDSASDLVSLDYRAQWQMLAPDGSTRDRTFTLVVRPAGGGLTLGSFQIIDAQFGTMHDTGFQTANIDLSAFIGQNVQLSFQAYIPEYFTGPGFMEVDNIRLSAVPEPSTLLLAGAFAVGFVALQRMGRLRSPKKAA
jgi:hypothetical protein